jgi:hypothetical protein
MVAPPQNTTNCGGRSIQPLLLGATVSTAAAIYGQHRNANTVWFAMAETRSVDAFSGLRAEEGITASLNTTILSQ